MVRAGENGRGGGDAGSSARGEGELGPQHHLESVDVMSSPDRLDDATRRSGLDEAVVTGSARIDGQPLGIAVMDFGFIGGSMGVVVGERGARAMERSASWAMPFVAVTASGGARVEGGLVSPGPLGKTRGSRPRPPQRPG